MAAKKDKSTKAGADNGGFAVIQTGGKQYKVSAGDTLRVEKVKGQNGSRVIFDKVLLRHDGENTMIGMPFVQGAVVEATLIETGKGKKIEVMKYKAKSRYMKIRGHRQPYSTVEITSIK